MEKSARIFAKKATEDSPHCRLPARRTLFRSVALRRTLRRTSDLNQTSQTDTLIVSNPQPDLPDGHIDCINSTTRPSQTDGFLGVDRQGLPKESKGVFPRIVDPSSIRNINTSPTGPTISEGKSEKRVVFLLVHNPEAQCRGRCYICTRNYAGCKTSIIED